jgi:hypothetical protein
MRKSLTFLDCPFFLSFDFLFVKSFCCCVERILHPPSSYLIFILDIVLSSRPTECSFIRYLFIRNFTGWRNSSVPFFFDKCVIVFLISITAYRQTVSASFNSHGPPSSPGQSTIQLLLSIWYQVTKSLFTKVNGWRMCWPTKSRTTQRRRRGKKKRLTVIWQRLQRPAVISRSI